MTRKEIETQFALGIYKEYIIHVVLKPRSHRVYPVYEYSKFNVFVPNSLDQFDLFREIWDTMKSEVEAICARTYHNTYVVLDRLMVLEPGENWKLKYKYKQIPQRYWLYTYPNGVRTLLQIKESEVCQS